MIRFIVQNQHYDGNLGGGWIDYYTMDLEVPELEEALTRGGHGEMGFDRHILVGVEILGNKEAEGDR